MAGYDILGDANALQEKWEQLSKGSKNCIHYKGKGIKQHCYDRMQECVQTCIDNGCDCCDLYCKVFMCCNHCQPHVYEHAKSVRSYQLYLKYHPRTVLETSLLRDRAEKQLSKMVDSIRDRANERLVFLHDHCMCRAASDPSTKKDHGLYFKILVCCKRCLPDLYLQISDFNPNRASKHGEATVPPVLAMQKFELALPSIYYNGCGLIFAKTNLVPKNDVDAQTP